MTDCKQGNKTYSIQTGATVPVTINLILKLSYLTLRTKLMFVKPLIMQN